jgi:SUMO ligase MMS21 Smc5/6 complex component
MKDNIIEIAELGEPKSMIQRKNHINTELIKTSDLIEELNKQLNLSSVMPTFILFAEWLQYNGKWSLPEQQVKDFFKEQQEQN